MRTMYFRVMCSRREAMVKYLHPDHETVLSVSSFYVGVPMCQSIYFYCSRPTIVFNRWGMWWQRNLFTSHRNITIASYSHYFFIEQRERFHLTALHCVGHMGLVQSLQLRSDLQAAEHVALVSCYLTKCQLQQMIRCRVFVYKHGYYN